MRTLHVCCDSVMPLFGVTPATISLFKVYPLSTVLWYVDDIWIWIYDLSMIYGYFPAFVVDETLALNADYRCAPSIRLSTAQNLNEPGDQYRRNQREESDKPCQRWRRRFIDLSLSPSLYRSFLVTINRTFFSRVDERPTNQWTTGSHVTVNVPIRIGL
jgi:hypothetical protein